MVQDLLVYPDDRINCTSTDVRTFDKVLWDIIEDMKDTMREHNLTALSAIQIAYPYSIIIVKQDNGYLELINPRILSQSGKFDSIERTSYYPDVEVTITRDEHIKLIYEDRNAKQKHMDISDKELSATLQRKIDYSFGGNFLDKVDKDQRDTIIKALRGNARMPLVEETCPTFSKKDYFISFTDKLLLFMGLSLFSPLILSKETIQTIYTIDKFIFPLIVVLMIVFFFYAQYEGEKYRSCTSCQVGNNIGVIVKRVVLGLFFAIASYFILGFANS